MSTGKEITDTELLGLVKSGDAGAFDAFVDRYGQRIMHFGLRMCRHNEDAEDVLQETMLTAYTGLKTVREPGAVRTWLYRVAANACRMKRRKSTRAREIALEDLQPPGWEEGVIKDVPDWSLLPEDEAVRSELRAALERAISELPHDYRIVVLLRDVEGLSTQETAQALDLGVSAVKMRLHRGRMELRQALTSFRLPGEPDMTTGST
jgi:RNA polymerase sigma-70 factor (ECF subfamily)